MRSALIGSPTGPASSTEHLALSLPRLQDEGQPSLQGPSRPLHSVLPLREPLDLGNKNNMPRLMRPLALEVHVHPKNMTLP